MTVWIVALTLAYVTIAVLLLSLNLSSSWAWPIKAGAITVTGVFYLFTYFAWHELSGWPASAWPPDPFVLVASEVLEPDKRTAESGAIVLWARPTDAWMKAPRAYRLPYDGALHQALLVARARQSEGVAQVGRWEKAGSRAGTDPQAAPALRFEDLPRYGLPAKE